MRHREIDNREIDGAVYGSSLYPKQRRDFERESVPSHIFNGWVIYTEEATNPSFSIAWFTWDSSTEVYTMATAEDSQ